VIYDITLKIRYDYTGAAAGGRQMVRITPLDVPGRQRVVASLIEITPTPAERRSWRDFFLNPTVEFALSGAHDHIDLTLRARVERQPAEGWLPLSIRLSDMDRVLKTCRDLDGRSPLHFVAPSVRIPHLPQIADYAAGLRQDLSADVTCQQVVLAIGHALHRDIRFDAKATTVDTPMAEAFANRHGVCQDMSHIMIAALRSLGIPAGYVSGFLRTLPPPGKPRLEGADAMHAWVRAWCGPETGWIDFDPTNDCQAGMDHIEVAWGRDYADVSPVKGILRVAGAQSSRQSVDVIPISG
jgi:transglutaminase-like putative cysteine protease